MRELDYLIEETEDRHERDALVDEMDFLDELRLRTQEHLRRKRNRRLTECPQSPLESPASPVQCPGAPRKKRLSGVLHYRNHLHDS